ncbi:MAG TPA: FAD-dependent monooxygenase [Candidatus Polarisedimenticolia bacterium]|nr:FAD-dependent monooxygenase [Candidatus Polarisedimenticolia bacterium]
MTAESPETGRSRTDVCVVGGGPAGLLLGLLLAKRGRQVVVLEGHETFDREFRGEVLQPSTARLLDQLGLLEYTLAQPHLTLTEGKLIVAGKVAGQFDFKNVSPEYPYAIWMPQPVFLEALVKKASTLPGFSCWMGAHATSLIEENGAVVGVRGMRHGKGPFEVRADVVVGADGRHSTIRRLGGFEIEYEYHDFDIVWFVVDPPPGWAKTIYFSIGSVPRLMLPKYPNQIQVGLILHRDEWHTWKEEGVSTVADRLRRVDPLFAPFADGLHDFSPFYPLPAVITMVRDWAKDGLLLIGDAAHTMSPAGAIGVNVALSTAAVAAQEVFPRLGKGPIPRGELARVQQLREADVRTLHKLQRAAGRALLGSGSQNSLLRVILPRVLPLAISLGIMPRVQRRLFFGAPLPPLDPGFGFRAS